MPDAAKPINAGDPFFIIGVQRSGTTLLRLMLNRHPKICIPPESHFILKLVSELPTTGTLSPSEIARASELILCEPRIASWQLSEPVVNLAISEIPKPELAEIIASVFKMMVTNNNKQRWGDKTPEYVSILDELETLFPNTKYVYIIRDGRDVVRSFAARSWHGCTLYHRARYLQCQVRKIDRFLKRLPTSRWVEIKYEDLVHNPEKTLRQVCEFLEEDFSEKMLSYYEDYHENLTITEKALGIHQKMGRSPRKGDVQKWRRDASAMSIFLTEYFAQEALSAHDYQCQYNAASLTLFKYAFPFYYGYVLIASVSYRLFHLIVPMSVKLQLRRLKIWTKLKSLIYQT